MGTTRQTMKKRWSWIVDHESKHFLPGIDQKHFRVTMRIDFPKKLAWLPDILLPTDKKMISLSLEQLHMQQT